MFVELLWTEALGRLGNILTVSIDQLSLHDVRFSLGLFVSVSHHKPSERFPLCGRR